MNGEREHAMRTAALLLAAGAVAVAPAVFAPGLENAAPALLGLALHVAGLRFHALGRGCRAPIAAETSRRPEPRGVERRSDCDPIPCLRAAGLLRPSEDARRRD